MHAHELQVLRDTIRKLYRRQAKRQLNNMFNKTHPADLALLFRQFTEEERLGIFKLLEDEYAAEVLSDLDSHILVELLTQMPPHGIVNLLKHLQADDEADILGFLPEDLAEEVLNMMKDEETSEIEELLKYGEETAGGIMNPEYFALGDKTTIDEAIHALQGAESTEMAFYIYIVDDRNHLVGVTSMRQLLTNPPDSRLSDIMTEKVVSVLPDVDQEEVARFVSRYNFIAIPVVDSENKLLGIVTIDDLVDVIREEATEDFFRMAGAGKDREILLKPTISVARLRFPWLFATWLGGIVASLVISFFSDFLQKWVIIAAYMPIIVGMGGNIGTQSSTIVVRGLATGRVEIKRAWAVLWKEVRVGILLGLTYGILLTIFATIVYDTSYKVGIAAGIGILCSMILATTMGTIAPIILQKFQVDPAIAAAPFVTTSIDILGITIYFLIASALLPS